MPVTVHFHRLALREYRLAEESYARQSERTLERFQSAVGRATEGIAATPELWPPFGRNHRWVKAGRFPYLLYFRKAGPDQILVVAVAHSRRRPGYWARRK